MVVLICFVRNTEKRMNNCWKHVWFGFGKDVQSCYVYVFLCIYLMNNS